MFQSTLPTRGSDAERHEYGRDAVRFQSTLPTRGSDAWCACPCRPDTTVSIHAPHEGERRYAGQYRPVGQGFNPRSPRGGATKHGVTIQDVARSFNPRSPRGGATHLFLSSRADSCNGFNPRSPRGGATGKAPDLAKAAKEFQSTLPTRGSDSKHIFYQALQTSFNPRSPRGGATKFINIEGFLSPCFNPRSPRGGATPNFFEPLNELFVSIHAPHEGERLFRISLIHNVCKFQSTLPTRGSDVLTFL